MEIRKHDRKTTAEAARRRGGSKPKRKRDKAEAAWRGLEPLEPRLLLSAVMETEPFEPVLESDSPVLEQSHSVDASLDVLQTTEQAYSTAPMLASEPEGEDEEAWTLGSVTLASSIDEPLRPVLLLPGIGGTLWAEGYEDEWYSTRGLHPDKLVEDPLAGVYDDLIVSLETAGYVRGESLFVVNYDWRMSPGPGPQSEADFDGVVTGLTAESISNEEFGYGVDYLGYFLGEASDAWASAGHGALDSVDIIAHSTGGLVARSYLQADFYESDDTLPKVHNFIMAGVPNRGASKPWNPMHNDWSVDPPNRVVLSKIGAQAYERMLSGADVVGGDGDTIRASDFDGMDEAEAQVEFGRRFVPTMNDLLATYAFFADADDLEAREAINDSSHAYSDLRNALLLDLNDGLDLLYTPDDLAADGTWTDPDTGRVHNPNRFLDGVSGEVTLVYNDALATLTTVTKHVGPIANELNLIVAMDQFVGSVPEADQVWFKNHGKDEHAPGDGTVPHASLVGQFLPIASDPRLTLVNLDEDDDALGHGGMMNALGGQAAMIEALLAETDIVFGTDDISTELAPGLMEMLSRVVSHNILNPMELMDGMVLPPEVAEALQVLRTGAQNLINQSTTLSGWANSLQGLGEHLRELTQVVDVIDTVFGNGGFAGWIGNTDDPLWEAPHTDDFLDTWEARDGTVVGGIGWSVDWDRTFAGLLTADNATLADVLELTGPEGNDQLVVNLAVRAEYAGTVPLNLDMQSDLLAGNLGAELGYTAYVDIDVAMGYDFDSDLDPEERAFFRLNDLHGEVSFDVEDIEADLQVGFAQGGVSGGEFSLGAFISNRISHPEDDPQRRFRGSDIDVSDTQALLQQIGDAKRGGSMELMLPVHASFADFTTEAGPYIYLAKSDVFDLTPVAPEFVDFEDMWAFTALDAGSVYDLFQRLAFALAEATQSDVMDVEIPFAQGVTLGDLLDYEQAIEQSILGELVDDDGYLTFDDLDGFVMALAEAAGVDTSVIDAHYDPQTRELRYYVPFAYAFSPGQTQFNLGVNAGPLAEIRSGGLVDFEASVAGGFGFGIDLSPLEAVVTAAEAAPADGRLSSTARFDLFLGSDDPVEIVVTRDTENETLDDLIEDINVALAAAGVADRVAARRGAEDASRIELFTKGQWTNSATLRLEASESNATVTELGFNPLHIGHDAIRDRAYVEDVTLTGEVSVNVDDVDAFGRFGFLDIDVDGANGFIEASADFALVNPDDGSARVGVMDLYDYLRDDAAATLGGLGFDGMAYATLPIAINPNPFGGDHPDDPRITLNWASLSNLDTLDLSYNAAMEELLGYADLDLATIVTGLGSLADFLGDQMADLPLLGAELPLINKSVAELFDLAGGFAQGVGQIIDDPNATLDSLADRLADGLGLSRDDIDLSIETGILRFDLSLAETFATSLPLHLDLMAMLSEGDVPDVLAGLEQFITAGTDGRLDVDVEAMLNVAFGVDLSDPENLTPVVFDATGVEVGAKVTGTDLTAELGVDGKLGLHVVDGQIMLGDPDDDDGMARFVAGLNPSAEGYYAVGDLSIDDFAVALTGSAVATLPLYFPTPAHPLAAQVDGDVESQPADAHHLVLEIAELADPLNTSSVTAPDISGLFDNLSLTDQLSYLVVGLDMLLEQVQHALQRDVFSQSLPIVGDQLSAAGDAIEDLRNGILASIGDVLADAEDTPATYVQQKLFEALGPDGLNVLGDLTGNDEITADDVLLRQGADYIEFELRLTPASFSLGTELAFDLNLPALELELDVNPQLDFDLNIDLVFGVHVDDGFYFDTSGEQVSAAIDVTIPDSSFSGRLAFLDIDVTDMGSSLGAAFEVDVTAPGNRLLWSDMAGGDGLSMSAELGGGANLDLLMEVSFGGNTMFPSMETRFVGGWDFDTDGVGEPSIAFEDVTVSAGEFIDEFVSPILSQIQEIIEPVQPVIDFLTQRLPIISDLLGSHYTVLDLIQWLPDDWAYVDGQLIEAMGGLLEVVDAVASLPIIDGELRLELGSFDLTGADDLMQSGGLLEFAPNVTVEPLMDPLQQFIEAYGSDEGAVTFVEQSSDLGGTGEGLEFPWISDPMQVFRLLLGQPVNLFTFDVPHIEFELEFREDFLIYTPPDIKIDLVGRLGGRIDLSFGYDTNGYQMYRESGEVADLVNGFYISDTVNADGTGPTKPEAMLWGALLPGLSVGFGGVGVGVFGGLQTTLYADLNDPNQDGKVHVNEFIRSARNGEEGLWCTFDLTGEVAAVLGVFFEAFGQRVESLVVDPIVLHDFTIFDGPCFPGRFEANESFADAADLGVGPGIHIVNGQIIDEYDVDWYRFELLHDDSIEMLFEYSQRHGNIDVEIYDADMNKIARSKSQTDDEHLVLRNLAAGEYFIYVFGSGDPVHYGINIDPYTDPEDPASSDTQVYYVADPDAFYVEWINYYATAPGDDVLNDGLSHDSPLATIGELLTRYELGPNDLVLIDGGRYRESVLITDTHSGATFAGAPIPHRTYQDFFEEHDEKHEFDRPMGGVVSNTLINWWEHLDLRIEDAEGLLLHKLEFGDVEFAGDAADNIIQHSRVSDQVHFLGGEDNSPTGNQLAHNLFTGNLGVQADSSGEQMIAFNTFQRDGVYLSAGAGAHIHDNQFERSGISAAGVALEIEAGAYGTIERNEISGYASGVVNHSFDVAFADNLIFENTIGMTGTGLLGAEQGSTANRIYENEVGVVLTSSTADAVVQHNRVYRNDVGIRSQGSGVNRIEGNRVYENQVGIEGGAVVGGVDWSAPNRIYDNYEAGIVAAADAVIRFNRITGNPVGMVAANGVHAHHNVLYRGDVPEESLEFNAGDPDVIAILLDGVRDVVLEHNTVYAPVGDAVVLVNSTRDTRLRNNIIWVQDGYAISVSDNSHRGFDSNYNNLYRTDDGTLVYWQKDFHDLYDWQMEVGQDLQSVGYTTVDPDRDDPLFVDAAGNDYRLTDELSTSIDAGDPTMNYSVEIDHLGHHGGRANLGAYGNTSQAAESVASWVRLAWPVYHVDWVVDRGAEIQWEAYNVEGDVRLTVEDMAGQTIATVGEFDVDQGWTFWSPADASLSPDASERYRFRITSVDDPATTWLMRESFAVPEASDGNYYINDASTADGVYTTAAGDNRNTGSSPNDPKASPLAMLRMYSLGPGDVVHVDTGEYLLPQNLMISGVTGIGDDEGVTFVGPTSPNLAAVFDRGVSYGGSSVVELHGADFTTLRHLTLVGGERGLYVHSDSTHFTGEHLEVRDAGLDGVTLTSSATDSALGHLVVHGHGRHGVLVETALPSLSDSRIYDNAHTGLYLRSTGDMQLERNVIYNNHYGIDIRNNVGGALTVIGSDDLESGDGNQIYGNRFRGVHAMNNVLVAGNAITDHAGLRAVHLQSGASATHNVVADADVGIYATGSQHDVAYNRVLNTTGAGISVVSASQVYSNVLGDNEIGIVARGSGYSGLIRNNIIYGSAAAGIQLPNSANGARIINNTIDQFEVVGFDPSEDDPPQAIRIGNSSRYIEIRNNIIRADHGEALVVGTASHVGFVSDYNLFWLSGGASFGKWQAAEVVDLQTWRTVSFQDAHSIAQDPLFVDAAGRDYHLQSTEGSFHGGTLAPTLDPLTQLPVTSAGTLMIDGGHSPGIDRGYEGESSDNEPMPNGGFINLGAYGNTSQASLSPEQYVLLIAPDGGQVIPMARDYVVRWRSHDFADTVDIHLLRDGEAEPVLEIAGDIDNTGQYVWTLPETLVAADDYRIRVDRGDGLDDTSVQTFTITDPVSAYYVNNDSLANAVYTTAIGSSLNDGLTPATPAASIRAILEQYDVGLGDTIFVDAGVYELTANILVTAADIGVHIMGAYDPTNPDAVTILDRNDTSSGSYVFHLNDFDHDPFDGPALTLEHLHITGARHGIHASGDAGANHVVVSNSRIYGNDWYGISVNSGNTHWEIVGNIFDGSNRRDVSMEGDHAQIIGNVFDNDSSQGLYLRGDNAHIETNTFRGGYNTAIDSRSNSGVVVVDNLVHGNRTGIDVRGSHSIVAGNTVYDHSTVGIYISGSNSVAGPYEQWGGNEVYDNARGMTVTSGATAEGNLVYNNAQGILINHGSSGTGIIDNVVHGNTSYGIRALRSAFISQNLVYDNARGIEAIGASTSNQWFQGTIANNVLYDNELSGIRVNWTNGTPTVRNNTIIQPGGDGIEILSNFSNSLQAVHVRNNIIVAEKGAFIRVHSATQTRFAGDHNIFHDAGAATYAWGGTAYTSLTDWALATGHDRHSFAADPQFVNPADRNYHLLPTSPGIAAGDLTDAHDQEPGPNGGRINIGAYGNTVHATPVIDADLLQILAPHTLEKHELGGVTHIAWRVWLDDFMQQYQDIVHQHDPVVHYRLNEQSGSAVTDSSGNGVHGVRAGGSGNTGAWGMESVLGPWHGSSLLIDASNGSHHIRGEDPDNLLELRHNVSMGMWINVEGTNRTWTPLLHKGDSTSNEDAVTFGLLMHNATRSLRLVTADGDGAQILETDADVIGNGAWHHVGAVIDRDSGQMSIYLDGEVVASASVRKQEAVASESPLHINGSHQNPYAYAGLDGGFDEIAVYDSVLDEEAFAAKALHTFNNVEIRLLEDDGSGNLSVVQTIADGLPRFGSFDWAVPVDQLDTDTLYRFEVTYADPSLSDVTAPFHFAPDGHIYYVNDGSLEDAVYTLAIGDDANHGKSPDAPMASLAALLETYDFSPGDIIYIDSGFYEVTRNIVLTEAHSGVTIVGAGAEGEFSSVFDRGRRSTGYYGFELGGVTDLTFDSIEVTNANVGIYAGTDAGVYELTLRDSEFYYNVNAGVSIGRGNDRLLAEGNTFYGIGPDSWGDPQRQDSGLEYGGNHAVIRHNIARDHYNHGFDIGQSFGGGQDNLFEYNIAHDNRQHGVEARHGSNSVFQHNIFHDNGQRGIWVQGSGTIVIQNEAYGNDVGLYIHSGSVARDNLVHQNDIGIELLNSGRAEYNEVFDNVLGIHSRATSVQSRIAPAVGNIVYNNEHGIQTRGRGVITDNIVFDNGRGITASSSFMGIIANNLVYDQNEYALRITSTGDNDVPEVYSNTFVHGDTGVAVILEGADGVSFRNNIVQANDADLLHVSRNSQVGFDSDYNIFHSTGEGVLFHWGDIAVNDRTDWYYEIGYDAHSIFGDPGFVDAASYDYHLLPTSPGVAAGDPDFDFRNEPAPNGGRINIGAYGNTAYATPTPTADLLQVLAPHLLEKHELGRSMQIEWRTHINDGLSQYGQLIQSLDPVAYYRLNELEGTHVADSSGNGRHGTRVGGHMGADSVLGRAHGYAYGHSDQSSHIVVEDTGDEFDLTHNVSMGMWINVEATHQSWSPLLYQGDGSNATSTFALWMNNSDRSLRLVTADAEGAQLLETDANVVDFNAWQHVGAVIDRDSGEMRLYLDGEVIASDTVRTDAAVSSADQPLYILRSSNNAWSHRTITGRIDEVAIYDAALTDTHYYDQAVGFRGTVDIDLLIANGDGTYSQALNIAASLLDDPDRAGFEWEIPDNLDTSVDYVIRVSSSEGESLYDQTAPFRFADDGNIYYINDASLDHAVYTTAIGDNLNTGKSADVPMASLNALLAAYELSAGDVIYVDSGTYEPLQNIVLAAEQSGVTIIGAFDGDNSDAVTLFDRGGRSSGFYAFELDGASDVTFENVQVTNARSGIYAVEDSGSHNLTILNSAFYYNLDAGVEVLRGNDGLTIEGSHIYGPQADSWTHPLRQNYGVIFRGHDGTFRHNDVHGHYNHGFEVGIQYQSSVGYVFEHNTLYDNRQAGIRGLGAHNAVIQHNHVFENGTGIDLLGDNGLITQNHAHHNDTGIQARGDGTVVIHNDQVHDNFLGIYILNGAQARENVVFDNTRGILSSRGSSSTVTAIMDNWVFGHDEWGIAGNRGSVIIGNRVFDNRDGIHGSDQWGSGGNRHFRGLIENNIVYNNEDRGIVINGTNSGNTVRVLNNTVYQEVGDAIYLTRAGASHIIANNILRVDLGYGVRATDAAPLASDYNLFYAGPDDLGGVARYDGEAYEALAEWQGASGQDAGSLTGDPLFVNMSGASNVLGGSFEGASDDNFRLSANSPAIDRGHSWIGPHTDIDGHARIDDPGTPNAGSDDYHAQLFDGNDFDDAVGSPQGWRHSGNWSWDYSFTDFSFEYYGETYDSITVGNNGLIRLEGFNSHVRDGNDSVDKLAERMLIAPLWTNLSTSGDGNNIFIDEQADQLTVRWHATHSDSGEQVEFSATLFADGSIRFDYGQAPAELQATIGVSGGTGRAYRLSPHSGQAGMAHADSVWFEVAPGYVDIGAYEFRGSSLDDTPPSVVDVSPVVIADEAATNQSFSEIIVSFSEVLDSINASAPASYALLGADSAGDFTSNMDLLPHYTEGEAVVTLELLDGTLADGTYQLVIFGENGVTDLAGIELDGNNDGQSGGDFVRTFTIDTVAPQVTFDALVTPDTSPQLTGGVDDAEADVTLTVNGETYNADVDDAGTWTLAAGTIDALEPGAYDVTVQAVDAAGNIGQTTVSSGLVIEAVADAEVVGRYVFYKNSAFDAQSNDDAIAPDKQALLPGETASFANYTSYVRGINGIIIDIADPADIESLSLEDFTFRIGNSDNVDTWAEAPTPIDLNHRAGEGDGGADRIELIWEDQAITQQWLEVTVLASDATGLAGDDVFYFGNAIGSTGHDPDSAAVGSQDRIDVRDNPHSFLNPAAIDNPYDLNRDGRVGAEDRLIVRDHPTSFLSQLQLISVPQLDPDPATAPAADADDEGEPEQTSQTTQTTSSATVAAIYASYQQRPLAASFAASTTDDNDSDSDARDAWWHQYLEEGATRESGDEVVRII